MSYFSKLKSILSIGILASSCFSASALALSTDELRINGFATIGVLATDASDAYYLEANNEYSFASETLAGLQFNLPVNQKASFVLQLISKGINDFEVEAEWAFAKINVNQYINVRTGRLRLPLYMISESLEVGFSYPWIRPPIEVYDMLDLDNFEGIETNFHIPIGSANLNIQPFIGSSRSEQQVLDETGDLYSEKLHGINLNLSYDWLAFRLGYIAGTFSLEGFTSIDNLLSAATALGFSSISDEFKINEFNGEFYAAGLKLTPGNLFIMAEYSQRRSNGVAYDADSWYLSTAYTLAEGWTPYIVFGHVESKKDYSSVESQLPALEVAGNAALGNSAGTDLSDAYTSFIQTNTKDHDSITLGLRMDLMDNIAFKLEWQGIDPKGNTDAWSITDSPGGNKVQLYSAAIDLAF